MKIYDVIIVGGGMAGIAASSELSEQGMHCLVLEKSRGLGGRASVRRGTDWLCDLGAQFTLARTKEMQVLLASQGEQIVCHRLHENLQPRYVHRLGLNSIIKAMLHPQMEAPITSAKVTCFRKFQLPNAELRQQGWQVQVEDGRIFVTKALLLTPPVTQTLPLLQSSDIQLGQEVFEKLTQVTYTKCICGIFETNFALPKGGILQLQGNKLSGIFDQQQKGLQSKKKVWLVQAGPTYSDELWNKEKAQQLEDLRKAIFESMESSELLNSDFIPLEIHAWRFAEAKNCIADDFFALHLEDPELGPLYLAGDAFRRSSIEAAFESGSKAAAAMVKELQCKTN